MRAKDIGAEERKDAEAFNEAMQTYEVDGRQLRLDWDVRKAYDASAQGEQPGYAPRGGDSCTFTVFCAIAHYSYPYSTAPAHPSEHQPAT